ncbi:MAG TPA: phosphoadenylyl-sulfate reductase [Luteibaculaceae bacterium]|nr:phosphoadenylyl-sulfate reductase [Luteibaculaceae bacterium]
MSTSDQLTPLSLPELLRNVAAEYGSAAVFSTSFSAEDQIISHHIFTQQLPIKVFTLDTGRLFAETYSVYERTLERYQATIEAYVPQTESLSQLISTKGPNSFYQSVENRLECCHIRKVEPLNRALQGAKAWITGLRAAHSTSRAELQISEWDTDRKLLKINPLLHWSSEEVWSEIHRLAIPYNKLHDKGFASIGCMPCTRATLPGEDFRAGRWWWEDQSKKECGLHIK